jgi:hypothetical protein
MSNYTNSEVKQRDPDLNETGLERVPTIKGKAGVVQFCADRWGICLTMNNVVHNTNTRQLPSHLIGGACWYSELDIYRWLLSNRRSTEQGVSA